ncbi:MAG TPA: hypothetical protein VEG34_19175 [Thermoanaerobaculia bacterium]|nr:hypothetical protein [Thermoanaerobaculia bacterium]
MEDIVTAGSAAEAVGLLARLAADSVDRNCHEDWDQVAPVDHLINAIGHLSAAARHVPHLTIGLLSPPDHRLFQAHCARASIFLAFLAFQPTD